MCMYVHVLLHVERITHATCKIHCKLIACSNTFMCTRAPVCGGECLEMIGEVVGLGLYYTITF